MRVLFCTKCGSQIPDGALFCAKCGAQAQMTTQAMKSAPDAAQSIPEPPSKRGPSGKLIGVAVAAIAVVAVVAAGFATNWFGVASGSGGSEPIYVLKSRVSATVFGGSSTDTEIWEAEFDEQGNRIRVKGDYSTANGSLEIEHDENGFVTKVSPSDGSSDAVSVMNEFDALGRLTRSAVYNAGRVALRASYSYYGDSDKLTKVSYNVEEGTDAVAYTRLYELVGQQLPGISYAVSALASGDGECEVAYSEAGALTAYGTSGAMTEVPTLSRENRAGQTMESGASSFTYDEHGNLVHSSFETESGSGIFRENDMTYELVTSPSRAVATFGRLYS